MRGTEEAAGPRHQAGRRRRRRQEQRRRACRGLLHPLGPGTCGTSASSGGAASIGRSATGEGGAELWDAWGSSRASSKAGQAAVPTAVCAARGACCALCLLRAAGNSAPRRRRRPSAANVIPFPHSPPQNPLPLFCSDLHPRPPGRATGGGWPGSPPPPRTAASASCACCRTSTLPGSAHARGQRRVSGVRKW